MPTAKAMTAEKNKISPPGSAGERRGAVLAPVAEPPEQRITLHGIRWETYESLLKDLEHSRAPRLTYDRGTLEIMSPLPDHEELGHNLEMLVEIAAEARDLDLRGLRTTTFRRKERERGFEPDGCFYIQHVERMRGKNRINLSRDPPPDLVIEIDLTHSTIDKLSLYAQLGVPEVWRYADKRVSIFVLRDGAYHEQAESAALPGLESAGMAALLEEAPSLRRPEWLRKVREWERAHRPEG